MSRKSRPPRVLASSYFERSQQPLQSLLFLLPLIAAYELGIHLYVIGEGGGGPDIYARALMRDFFQLFGVAAYYLPAVIVVVVLLSWHVVRRDPWRVEPRLYALMLAESVLLAVPLFVFGLVIARQPQIGGAAPPLQMLAQAGGLDHWPAQLVFSIGAGIYEELLFRLIAIALLHALLADALAIPEPWAAVGSIGASAIAFALYHFSRGNFELGLAIYYTVAGVYFAGVYITRGFGIVAASHAFYDVLVVILSLRAQS